MIFNFVIFLNIAHKDTIFSLKNVTFANNYDIIVQMSDNIGEKPEIKLPFEGDKFDIGEWAYAHRIGLSVTLIVYLIIAISFMLFKITLEINPKITAVAIDLQQLAELERKRDELKRSVEILQQMDNTEWQSIQNKISNESASQSEPRFEEQSQVQDDRNTNVDKLLADAAEFQRKMAQNRADYESGLAEAKAIKERKQNSDSSEQSNERRDQNIKGNVTVSYSFESPVRHAQRLTVPAYQCEGGGEVVVTVVVNQNGDVTSAKVVSGGDDCMQQTALSAAQSSRFNVDVSAPSKHQGRISYIFVPQ